MKLVALAFLAVVAFANATLLGAGSNSAGQLGFATPASTNSLLPINSSAFYGEAVESIKANFGQGVAVLAVSGNVYVWGSFGGSFPAVSTAIRVLNVTAVAQKPTTIALGGNDTQAAWLSVITADGILWSVGSGVNGQLGNNMSGSGVASATFVRTGTGFSISGENQLCTGFSHTVAIAADGSVYAWGSNSKGQLGLGASVDIASIPQIVSGLTGISSVHCGGEFTIAVSSNQEIFVFGDNTYGQLILTNATHFDTPASAGVYDGAITVVAGKDNTFVIGDTTTDSYGNNANSQLGHVDGISDVALTLCLNLEVVAKVFPCSDATFFLSASGKLCAIGQCSNGKCGIDTPALITSTEAITSAALTAPHPAFRVACGSDFSIVQTVPEPWIEPKQRTLLPTDASLAISGKFFSGTATATVSLDNSLNCSVSNVLDYRIVCQLSGTLPALGTVIKAVVSRDGLVSVQADVAVIVGGVPYLNSSGQTIFANAEYIDLAGGNFPPAADDINIIFDPLGTCQSIQVFNSSSLRCTFGDGPDRGILKAQIETSSGTSVLTEVAVVQEVVIIPPITPKAPVVPTPAPVGNVAAQAQIGVVFVTLLAVVTLLF